MKDIINYIKSEDVEFIRSLDEFDFRMVLGEIHDHGWHHTKKRLLPLVKQAIEANGGH